jgi:hypothetical protein
MLGWAAVLEVDSRNMAMVTGRRINGKIYLHHRYCLASLDLSVDVFSWGAADVIFVLVLP